MIVNEHGLNWYHLSPRFPMKNVIVNVYGGFEWQRHSEATYQEPGQGDNRRKRETAAHVIYIYQG